MAFSEKVEIMSGVFNGKSNEEIEMELLENLYYETMYNGY